MKRVTILLILAMTILLAGCIASQAAEESTGTVAPTLEVSTETTAQAATPTTAADNSSEESATVDQPAAVVEEPTQTSETTETATVAVPVVVPVVNSKLNLNSVSADELLATIPGFSSRMTREFAEYAPYVSIQQFRREIGKYVDDATVAGYEQYVYVPIDINESDAATMAQIPGLDAATAEALMAARPFDSAETFLAELATLAPAVDVNVAAGYLK